VKLKEELKDEFEIYLLCSDTILGKLAGEIIENFITFNLDMFNAINIKCDLIEDLQVKDRAKFSQEGMTNIIKKLYNISNSFWDNLIINITGGFKAIIPYLTILGQINRCPIYYIFEATDVLIRIPNIPLDVNWRIFEKNEGFFMELEKEKTFELASGIVYRDEIESLIEREDNLISFNPLGVALWEKYKERFELFYISEMAKKYIETQDQQIKQISEKSFLELKRRLKENPSDPDLDHKLKDMELKGFKCFKHKEENLQVRMLYKVKEWETVYNIKELNIYIADIAIGRDVHNAGNESEYIQRFKDDLTRIQNLEEYKTYRIEK
jgi:CRISPR/Cas system-associated protein Csm6